MVKELADAKYTEEEIKERIDAEKKLETFQRLEMGDPGVYEVNRNWKYCHCSSCR